MLQNLGVFIDEILNNFLWYFYKRDNHDNVNDETTWPKESSQTNKKLACYQSTNLKLLSLIFVILIIAEVSKYRMYFLTERLLINSP